MLPPVPTDKRLSFAMDQFTGSGQTLKCKHGLLTGSEPRRAPMPFYTSPELLGSSCIWVDTACVALCPDWAEPIWANRLPPLVVSGGHCPAG